MGNYLSRRGRRAADKIRSRASRIGDSEAVLCFSNRISLLLPLTESLAAQIEAP